MLRYDFTFSFLKYERNFFCYLVSLEPSTNNILLLIDMSKLSQLKDKRKETAADKVCAPFIDQIYSDEKQLYFEFLLKVLQKSEKLFVEKGYRLLTLRKVGDQFTIGGDQRSVKRLRNNLALKDMLEKLFMDEEGDDESSEFEFTNTQTVDIPPLFAQPGNKGQGWNSKNIERYLVLLLNLLGAGKGGAVSLGDKTKKPLWFSSKVDWRKFSSPSHASMVENVDLIKGIFAYLITSTWTSRHTTFIRHCLLLLKRLKFPLKSKLPLKFMMNL